MPAPAKRRLRALLAAAIVAFAALGCLPRPAFAHASVSTTYSKFEATTSGQAIAVVFAFDTAAMLRQLQRDAGVRVDRSNLNAYGDLFAPFLFSHFSISNDGQACTHLPALAAFFWSATGDHVIAVTKFDCPSPLGALVIRSVVTRDMPLRHDTVGDLRHGRALVRHFFSGTDTEAHVDLSSLPQAGPGSTPAAEDAGAHLVRPPDVERLYEELAAKTLGIDLPAEAPHDVRPMATLAHFIGEGILHIFSGYDHIAFIVTLILAVTSWRQLALIVTSFTAAHSITLALATLGLVTLPGRLVEPLIALSVLIVAVDTIARPHAKARMAMAFGFGLVHGLGLANVLRDLGLSGRELLPALLGFNVGVEIGQLAIVAPMFVLVLRLRKREAVFARWRSILCAGVAVAAAIWFLLRIRAAFA
jgi:hydrogenase/urease accessory protein HupE